MALADLQTLMSGNLAFAVTRGGQDVTLSGITGKAVVSAVEKSLQVEDMGQYPRVNISVSLPVSTWATAPVVSALFTTGGETYRILSVLKSFCGHAWSIVGEHVSGS